MLSKIINKKSANSFFNGIVINHFYLFKQAKTMKKLLLLTLFTLPLSATELVARSFFDNEITLSIPSTLEHAQGSTAKAKYLSEQQPKETYLSQSSAAAVAFTLTDKSVRGWQFSYVKDKLSDKLHSRFPQAIWHREELLKNNEQPLLVYEFVYLVGKVPTKKTLYAFLVRQKLAMISVDVATAELDDWSILNAELMNTLDQR